jgi:hypothetical protein
LQVSLTASKDIKALHCFRHHSRNPAKSATEQEVLEVVETFMDGVQIMVIGCWEVFSIERTCGCMIIADAWQKGCFGTGLAWAQWTTWASEDCAAPPD